MPWLSAAQARWGNSPAGLKALGGAAKVKEWNDSTNFKDLPQRKGPPRGSTRVARIRAKRPARSQG